MDDEGIVRKVQQGDTQEFGALIDRYQERMTRYARRFLSGEDVTDAVQDVFLRAFTNIQSFRDGERFSPWLYRVAHNVYVNALRDRSHRPVAVFDLDLVFPHLEGGEASDRMAITTEEKTAIEAALGSLDPKYREPIVLFYFEELSYDEIADILHIPRATVGVRLKRARERLSPLLAHHRP